MILRGGVPTPPQNFVFWHHYDYQGSACRGEGGDHAYNVSFSHYLIKGDVKSVCARAIVLNLNVYDNLIPSSPFLQPVFPIFRYPIPIPSPHLSHSHLILFFPILFISPPKSSPEAAYLHFVLFNASFYFFSLHIRVDRRRCIRRGPNTGSR